jgi:hypothetical protein
MNDPKRLLDEAPGTFARDLMASSSEDVPPLQAKERARSVLFAGAVGISAAAVAAQSSASAAAGPAATAPAAAASAGIGTYALAKWTGIAAVALAGTGGAAYLVSDPAATPPSAVRPAVSQGKPAVGLIETTPSSLPAETSDIAPAPAPAVSNLPKSEAAPAKRNVAPPSNSGALSEEIAAMDAARHGLARGDRMALDRYLATYPRGVFREQALAMRIRALLRSGQGEQARAEARAFLRAYPKSAEVPALRRLLEQ